MTVVGHWTPDLSRGPSFSQSELLEFTSTRTKLQQLGSFIFPFDDIHTRLSFSRLYYHRFCVSRDQQICMGFHSRNLNFLWQLLILASFFTWTSSSFANFSFSAFQLLLLPYFFSACSDQCDMYLSVLRRCMLTLLNWPLKQGQTGQSCRTCWLTSEMQRICLTCSLPRLLSPGPAQSASMSTRGTEPMKVLSSANADLKYPPLWIALSIRSFKLTRLRLFGSQWRRWLSRQHQGSLSLWAQTRPWRASWAWGNLLDSPWPTRPTAWHTTSVTPDRTFALL